MVGLPLPRPQQLIDDAFVHTRHADSALEHRRLVLRCALVIDADATPLIVQLIYRQLPHQAPASTAEMHSLQGMQHPSGLSKLATPVFEAAADGCCDGWQNVESCSADTEFRAHLLLCAFHSPGDNPPSPEWRLHGGYDCSVVQAHVWRGWRRAWQVPLPQRECWAGVPAAWALRGAHGPVWAEVLAASLTVASAGHCRSRCCLCCCCFCQHLCCAGAAVYAVEVLTPCGSAWVTYSQLSTTSVVCTAPRAQAHSK